MMNIGNYEGALKDLITKKKKLRDYAWKGFVVGVVIGYLLGWIVFKIIVH